MKYVFIIGCPRSGTTWLQMLLAQHSRVATAQETHLFSNYIQPLRDNWESNSKSSRGIGLQSVLTAEEFNTFCADFATTVMHKIGATNSRAAIILEKTPTHVRHVPLILKLFPDAYFIHLIRDPRSVAVSLTRAGRSWGSSWASPDYAANAQRWVSDVTRGQGIGDLTDRFREIYYEDLVGNSGQETLGRLLRWFGLRAGAKFCAQAFEACRIDRLRDKSGVVKAHEIIASDPPNFYSDGTTRGWTEKLTLRELHIVEHIAGEKMQEIGYALQLGERARHKPLELRLRDALTGVEWRASRLLSRIFEKIRLAV